MMMMMMMLPVLQLNLTCDLFQNSPQSTHPAVLFCDLLRCPSRSSLQTRPHKLLLDATRITASCWGRPIPSPARKTVGRPIPHPFSRRWLASAGKWQKNGEHDEHVPPAGAPRTTIWPLNQTFSIHADSPIIRGLLKPGELQNYIYQNHIKNKSPRQGFIKIENWRWMGKSLHKIH